MASRAAAPNGHLAWELPYAAGVAILKDTHTHTHSSRILCILDTTQSLETPPGVDSDVEGIK